MFRRPIGEERGEERQRDLDARIVDPAPQPQHQPADADAPDDLADYDGDERAGGLAG